MNNQNESAFIRHGLAKTRLIMMINGIIEEFDLNPAEMTGLLYAAIAQLQDQIIIQSSNDAMAMVAQATQPKQPEPKLVPKPAKTKTEEK